MGTPVEFFEKNLEDIIFENRATIQNHGLPPFRKTTFRQFILPSGKKLDIFSFDLIEGHLFVEIYELKLYRINTDAICQAYEYYKQIRSITAGYFKSVDIHITMIGREYDPIMIFEKMNLPFSAYTYEFKITGMTFIKHIERKQYKEPHENFSLGLWAFGNSHLYYPNDPPDSINLATLYQHKRNENNELHQEIVNSAGAIFKQPIIREVPIIQYIERPSLKTEIFPIQPSWTKEFMASIPDDIYMFDLDNDLSDYELEPIESDISDYEVEHEECDESEHVEYEFLERLPSIVREDELPIIQINSFLQKIMA